VFNDDDDVFTVGAFEAIHAAVDGLPEPRPVMFRFVTPWREVLWDKRRILESRTGGHQFVCPNDHKQLGQWTDRYEGDYDFIRNTVDFYGDDAVIWKEDIIAVCRP
jgi:hypothetical protein